MDMANDQGEITNAWRTNATTTGNLAHEHCPEMYMSWMLSSDNPQEIFTESQGYIRLVYKGTGKLAVVDREAGRCVLAVDENGENCTEKLSEEEKRELSGAGIEGQMPRNFYSASQSGVRVLVIPTDRVYDVYEFSAIPGGEASCAISLSTADHNRCSVVRYKVYESIGDGAEKIYADRA